MDNKTEQQKRTNRYVAVSFGLHVALIVGCSVGAWFAPPALVFTPAVQIDMVALPNQVKQQDPEPVDTSLPVKPDEPPPSIPVDVEAPKEPEAKAPEETEDDRLALEEEKRKKEKDKKKAAELDAKKRAADAMKRLKEEQKRQRLEDDRRRQEALDKRKKDLKDFKDKYRTALRGNQVNQGNAVSGEMQAALNAYQGHLVDRLRSKWTLPPYLQGKGYRAVMRIWINGQGHVFRMEFKQVSGNNLFDNQVESAVRNSSPFQPPPAEMADGLRSAGVEVQFPL